MTYLGFKAASVKVDAFFFSEKSQRMGLTGKEVDEHC